MHHHQCSVLLSSAFPTRMELCRDVIEFADVIPFDSGCVRDVPMGITSARACQVCSVGLRTRNVDGNGQCDFWGALEGNTPNKQMILLLKVLMGSLDC